MQTQVHKHFRRGNGDRSRADGIMFAEDHGTMEVNPVGPWPFETHVVIHSGNGAWNGAHGELVAIGALDTNAGITEGDYSGFVCL